MNNTRVHMQAQLFVKPSEFAQDVFLPCSSKGYRKRLHKVEKFLVACKLLAQ